MVFDTSDAIPIELTTALNQPVDSKYTPFFSALFTSKAVDILLLPTITQITYLLCNKRNVTTLWKSLKSTLCKSNAVDPNVSSNYMENMETTRQ
ncbi:hypothetical protein B9Z55_026715 [Caenorhabditis nigoni]|uniref:Uncharacterized protein n=1 Tax=Caenorhabditis nigoni TaxID=1611254 RepID=A0A2G5SH18_9PELO|nr:hypothetical protein B9Z55_026715 [Caenorhabditis nigoni]